MEQELTVDKDYLKGFNNGYLLAIHEPDLAAKLVSHKNDHNEYFKGLVAGKHEHDMEKIHEHLRGVPKDNSPSKNIDNDKGKTK